MTEQTYDYKGTNLKKVPEPEGTFCHYCFFRIRDSCDDFVKNVSNCITKEGSLIFVKANEPVNKID